MDLTISIILFLFGFILGGLIIWFIRQKEIDSIQSNQDRLKAEFGNLSKEALDQNLETFLKLAENKFSELVKSSDGQLDQKKELIDQSLVEMKKKLEGLDKSTNELKGQVETSQKGIGDLADTTSKLSRVLSSSQARGQWGEKMVEDILNFMGLIEGINFKKQSQMDEGRPDFTFMLPDQKCINMDVKFPLTHYENFLDTENNNEKEKEKKAFLNDVRNHIKSIEKRTYIDPESGTVDYGISLVKNLLVVKPIFGICLGHQILALALGAKTFKLKFGHRGINHPVKNLITGKIEITSQNHGFAVDLNSLPSNVIPTHLNLNDNTSAGIKCSDIPAFSVQYHPESSPGPNDSRYLFDQFIDLMKNA